jgi:hypothetical protein
MAWIVQLEDRRSSDRPPAYIGWQRRSDEIRLTHDRGQARKFDDVSAAMKAALSGPAERLKGRLVNLVQV